MSSHSPSSSSPYEQLAPPYRCPDCGSAIAFRSRRRSLTERFLLPMVLLQPVRCAECFRRDYRLLFTPVQQRMADTQKLTSTKVPAASTRNVA